MHFDAPIVCPEQKVEPAWIDYNGHMNMAFYNVAFDRGVDHLYDLLGVGAEYARSGAGSLFTMEVHVHYLNELVVDDPLSVRIRLLDFDSKRLHFFEEMYHATEGYLAATSEQLALHVDMQTRRSAPLPAAALSRVEDLLRSHSTLPRPEQVGHVIGIPARR
ncbi:MAG: thioesterase family protein [Pseudomonadales bacterium]